MNYLQCPTFGNSESSVVGKVRKKKLLRKDECKITLQSFGLKKFIRYNQIFTSGGVFIKPAARLYAVMAGSYHINQQGTRGILLITKAVVQYVKYSKTDIQSNKICQL
jgi:hypothetical protein